MATRFCRRRDRTLYNDSRAPYFKFGLYNGWKDPVLREKSQLFERTVYHDALKIAVGDNVRYQDVAPSGQPASDNVADNVADNTTTNPPSDDNSGTQEPPPPSAPNEPKVPNPPVLN